MIRPEDSHEFSTVVTYQTTANPTKPTGVREPLLSIANGGDRPTLEVDAAIGRQSTGRRRGFRPPSTKAILASLLSASPAAMAACVPLQGSKACSAFQSSSVSTDSFLVGLLYVVFCIVLGEPPAVIGSLLVL